MCITPSTWYCFPLRAATAFRTAPHTLLKKKKRPKKTPSHPLPGVNAAGSAAAPGRALFAVGSGAGDGRAPLGSALVALLMHDVFMLQMAEG